jgi:HemY protein
MLRAVFFALKVGILVGVCVWVANRPGHIDVSWLGYNISIHMGFALLVLLFLTICLLIGYRIFLGFISFPKSLKRYKKRMQRKKGQKALTLGLSAVAAGDSKAASYQAYRMRKFLPDEGGITFLLEAQAARLRGDDDAACCYFEDLVKDEDTALLGLRGMMLSAMEKGNMDEALSFARQAMKLHPKQPWIVRMVYSLELREQRWEDAQRTLRKARKYNVISKDQADSDLTSIYLYKGSQALDAGNDKQALRWLKKAQSVSPIFPPVIVRLAEFYSKQGKEKAALNLVSKAWEKNPHPDIIKTWKNLGAEGLPDRFAIDTALETEEGKIWNCKETGRIYESWSPIAEPHGSFNTIVWDYPMAIHDKAIADRTELLITAPM